MNIKELESPARISCCGKGKPATLLLGRGKTIFQEEISMMAADVHYEASMCPPQDLVIKPQPHFLTLSPVCAVF